MSDVRYAMNGLMEQCAERYVELANTPGRSTGELTALAAKVLMNVLYDARMLMLDFLELVNVLAREVSRWACACDKKLCKLICYTNSALDMKVIGHIVGSVQDCRLFV